MADWTNPLPLTLGGGPTDIESTWQALRSLVGGEHGPGPEGGIEDLARQQEATAIAGAERNIERAFLQHFPAYATAGLSMWEALLLVGGAEEDVELRELLALAWQRPDGATTPHLSTDLTAIDAALSIAFEDDDDTITTIPGKYLAADNDAPPFATGVSERVAAVLPNFASTDILRVVYQLEAGELFIPPEVIAAVTKLLHRRLPSAQTWTLTGRPPGGGGLLLDGGPDGDRLLDLTALG